jgi:hypothetical protein
LEEKRNVTGFWWENLKERITWKARVWMEGGE